MRLSCISRGNLDQEGGLVSVPFLAPPEVWYRVLVKGGVLQFNAKEGYLNPDPWAERPQVLVQGTGDEPPEVWYRVLVKGGASVVLSKRHA
jgi:protein-L-isoaspartate O-methyltransferase